MSFPESNKISSSWVTTSLEPPRVLEPPPSVGGGRFSSLLQHDATTKKRGYIEPSQQRLASGHHHHQQQQQQPPREVVNLSGPVPKLRYTREELLKLFVHSNDLGNLHLDGLPEGIISPVCVEPELLKPFDNEELLNTWYESVRPVGGQLRGNKYQHSMNHHHHQPPPNAQERADHWRQQQQLGKNPMAGGAMDLNQMDLAQLSLNAVSFERQFKEEREGKAAAATAPVVNSNSFFAEKVSLEHHAFEPLESGLTFPPEEDLSFKEVLPSLPSFPSGNPWGMDIGKSAFPSSMDLLTSNSVFGSNPLDLLSGGNVFHSSSVLRTASLLPPARTTMAVAPTTTATATTTSATTTATSGVNTSLFASPPPPPSSLLTNAGVSSLLLPTPPVPATVDEWYYMDPQKAVQGPFSSKEMKEWFDAGYFTPDLPICYAPVGGELAHGGSGKFYALSAVFPTAPFSTPPPAFMLQHRHSPAPEISRLVTPPPLASTPVESKKKEEEQRKVKQDEAAAWNVPAVAAAPSAPAPVKKLPASERKQAKKAAQQAAAAAALLESTAATAAPVAVVATTATTTSNHPAPSNNSSLPAWGKTETMRAPTLKEIQELEEEKRKASLLQRRSQPVVSMASHVARSVGIETNTLLPPTATTTADEPVVVKSTAVVAPTAAAVKSSMAAAAPSAPKAKIVVKEMSSEFRTWCVLHSNAVVTMELLELCFGMENSEEARDILKEQVSESFSKDFIKRMNADKQKTALSGSIPPVVAAVMESSSDVWTSAKSPKKVASKKKQTPTRG